MKKNVIVIALALVIASMGGVSYASISLNEPNEPTVEQNGGGDEDKKKCSKSCKKECKKSETADRAENTEEATSETTEKKSCSENKDAKKSCCAAKKAGGN